jgi:hypothetical protein
MVSAFRGGMAVQLASTYVHAIDGRLRVKVTTVKGSPAKAAEIAGRLRALEGVRHVKANPITGNVLVLYGPGQIDREEVLAALDLEPPPVRHQQAWARPEPASRSAQSLFESVAESVVRFTVEIALQRLVSALI